MKTLYVVAGANGSGKTTFAKTFATLKSLHFINADEIAKMIDASNINGNKIKAGKIFFEELQFHLEQEKSFVIETTLSGKYLVKYLQTAQEAGFYVSLIYLFLETPATNILRVQHRVLNGGHDIPTEDIIRRFFRSKKMFWNVYRGLADEWIVYYNSNEIFEEIADQDDVYDKDKYQEFMKDINNEAQN